MSNYPYWNAAHSYDATLTAPVFDQEGILFGFLLVRAHWMDLGAKDPGYVLDSTDMHQEGPPGACPLNPEHILDPSRQDPSSARGPGEIRTIFPPDRILALSMLRRTSALHSSTDSST